MNFDKGDTAMRASNHIVRCQECRARIIFLENPATHKRVPVDADTVEDEDDTYESGRHVSHFKTCTNPQRFSKRPR